MTAMNHQLRGGNADHIASPATTARAARTRSGVQRAPASLDHRRSVRSGVAVRVADDSVGVTESSRPGVLSCSELSSTALLSTAFLCTAFLCTASLSTESLTGQ